MVMTSCVVVAGRRSRSAARAAVLVHLLILIRPGSLLQQQHAGPQRRSLVCGAERRQLVKNGAAAAVVVSTTTMTSSAANAEEVLLSSPALLWRNTTDFQTCSPSQTRKVFNERFVSYLARFLLNYDKGSRLFWRATGEEIPLSWNEPKARRKRAEQFAEFASSVEAGLCPYALKCFENNSPQLGVRQLLSLLRSRYSQYPDGSRQLALLFSLLEPPYQPNDAIATLSARAQNASVVGVKVIDGGLIVATRKALADSPLIVTALPKPAIDSPRETIVAAKLAAPRLEATGRVAGFVVEEGGCGYDEKKPPLVNVAPPLLQQGNEDDPRGPPRAAAASAIVDDGRIVRLDISDGGARYEDADAASVEIEPAADASKCGVVAAASPVFEFTVAGVDVLGDNSGYTSSQPGLDIVSLLEPAVVSGVKIVRKPTLKVVLADRGERFVGVGAAMWAPRGAAATSLTSLLQIGLPIWDGQRHVFPAVAFGAITPTRSVRRDVALSPTQLARLALAGALCTSATRAALNPLDLAKTRKQAGLAPSDKLWTGIDATAASGAALGACSFAVFELMRRQLPRLAVAVFRDKSIAAQYEFELSLLASLAAVLVAAATVAPFEAAKVRIMLDEKGSNLPKAIVDIADGQYARLWSSFWPLVARELPFTTAKLLTYSASQAALFAALPASRERPLAALAVNCVSGALAGAAGALLSAPADAVVTELASGKHADDPLAAMNAVLSGPTTSDPQLSTAVSKQQQQEQQHQNYGGRPSFRGRERLPCSSKREKEREGSGKEVGGEMVVSAADDVDDDAANPFLFLISALPRLFAGVNERMLLFSIIITVQLVLFDFSRSLLNVTPEDLSLSIDLFSDRLSFYDY